MKRFFFGQHPSRTKGSVEVRGAFSAFSAIQTEKRSELPNYSKTRNCLYTHKMARILRGYYKKSAEIRRNPQKYPIKYPYQILPAKHPRQQWEGVCSMMNCKLIFGFYYKILDFREQLI
ncbi:hypothetical protein C6499_01730 [Candidatus Poribacteria bacterium]|nr:MAG: hypothetical protein C6499_01730 [Candidatus Poribacteria bacterium]